MPEDAPPSTALTKVRQLLAEGRAQAALEAAARSGQNSDEMRNARGVCLLRLGRAQEAETIFRSLAFPNNAPCVTPEVPTVYQANFVAASILNHNLQAALGTLKQIRDTEHPAVRKLLSAVSAWRKGMGLHRRLLTCLGLYPAGGLPIDSPGDID